MVMGLDGTKRVLQHHPEIMAYLIYSDKNGKNAIWYSPSMKDKIAH
jgi:thiamine biosynthesis lipoprotein